MFTNNIHNACIRQWSRKGDKGSERETFGRYSQSTRLECIELYEIYKEPPYLTYVMLQWNQGIFHERLSIATVKPLRKQGDSENAQNYSTHLSHQNLHKF